MYTHALYMNVHVHVSRVRESSQGLLLQAYVYVQPVTPAKGSTTYLPVGALIALRTAYMYSAGLYTLIYICTCVCICACYRMTVNFWGCYIS